MLITHPIVLHTTELRMIERYERTEFMGTSFPFCTGVNTADFEFSGTNPWSRKVLDTLIRFWQTMLAQDLKNTG